MPTCVTGGSISDLGNKTLTNKESPHTQGWQSSDVPIFSCSLVFSPLCQPRVLVAGVVHHCCLPLAIILVIQVLVLYRVRIQRLLWDVVATHRLDVLWVIDLYLIHTVVRLALVRVLDPLVGKEIKSVIKLPIADGLVFG